MKTPASIRGHPIHPMLVTVPIGLWIFSFVCDLVFVLGSGAGVWATIALYLMAGGLIGALAAAIPGLIDFISVRHSGAGRVALAHMLINLTVVAIYAVNFFLRIGAETPVSTLIWVSAFTLVLLLISGWLGGHMVYELGVGVSDSAPMPEKKASKRSVRAVPGGV